MNCAVHTDREATGYCRNCGKALCPECTREVRGALYCEDCLADLLAGQLGPGGPGAAAGGARSDANPASPPRSASFPASAPSTTANTSRR